jgi:hypothetical protein
MGAGKKKLTMERGRPQSGIKAYKKRQKYFPGNLTNWDKFPVLNLFYFKLCTAIQIVWLATQANISNTVKYSVREKLIAYK